ERQVDSVGYEEDDPGQRQPVQGLGYELLHFGAPLSAVNYRGSGTCSPALPRGNQCVPLIRLGADPNMLSGAGYTPFIIISVTTGGAARQRRAARPVTVVRAASRRR